MKRMISLVLALLITLSSLQACCACYDVNGLGMMPQINFHTYNMPAADASADSKSTANSESNARASSSGSSGKDAIAGLVLLVLCWKLGVFGFVASAAGFILKLIKFPSEAWNDIKGAPDALKQGIYNKLKNLKGTENIQDVDEETDFIKGLSGDNSTKVERDIEPEDLTWSDVVNLVWDVVSATKNNVKDKIWGSMTSEQATHGLNSPHVSRL